MEQMPSQMDGTVAAQPAVMQGWECMCLCAVTVTVSVNGSDMVHACRRGFGESASIQRVSGVVHISRTLHTLDGSLSQ